jgi:hypothetical protein
MEIGKDDVKDIMAIVSACAQDLYPDDAIKQAEHINNSYGSLLNLMGEVEWK